MKRFDQQWQRLISTARLAPDLRGASAPYGFTSRVVAQAASMPTLSPWGAFERFALRGLLAAAAFSVSAVAFHYSKSVADQVDVYATADTVTEILDFS